MSFQKRKSTAALLSVLSNTVLVVFKLIAGFAIGSVSVISEAIHSAVDLVAALIAYLAVIGSGKPADKEHPFGHGKLENISGTIEALLIFAAAGWIIYEAIMRLLNPQPLEAPMWGIIVMGISAAVNMGVSSHLFKVGKETDSIALIADGWHLRTDVYTSLGVFLGLSIIWLGSLLAPDWNLHWIDPVAALLIALLILKAAYELTIQAGKGLMDSSLPEEEQKWVEDYIENYGGSTRGFHNLKTRKAGSERFIEFHLLVSGEMSVSDSHDITEIMTRDFRAKYPGVNVIIHIEPCDGSCPSHCVEGCFMSDEEREKIKQNTE